MIAIPLFPLHTVTKSLLPPPIRTVRLAKSLHHALQLQTVCPSLLIGLPSYIRSQDLEHYTSHMQMDSVCAVGSLRYPLRSFDIIHETRCSKLLIEHILLSFDAEKRLIAHEEVIVLR